MCGRDCATECITVTTADVQIGNKLGVQTNVKVIGLTTPAAVEETKQTLHSTLTANQISFVYKHVIRSIFLSRVLYKSPYITLHFNSMEAVEYFDTSYQVC